MNKTYDGTAFSGDPNGNNDTGFKYGQGEGNLGGTLVYTGTSQGDKNAGTYVITPGGYTSNDYAITFVNGALNVAKAALTVTADDQSKTYGGTDPTPDVHALGHAVRRGHLQRHHRGGSHHHDRRGGHGGHAHHRVLS